MPDTATSTRAQIFVNASSGWDTKADAPRRLEQLFADAGIDAEIESVQHGVNLADKARQAVIEGIEMIVAAGGDGTLSATAAGLVGTEAKLGILPVGTLNHFARDLNLPLDLEAAADVVCAGYDRRVDVGEVNGKTFLNNAVIGLYPIFRAIRADLQNRGWPAKLSWLWAWATTIRKMPFFRLRLIMNGREIERRTPYMLIGNNEHAMEGWHLGSRTTMQSGKLWLYVLRPQSRLALLGMACKILLGRFHRQEHFDVYQTQDFYVDTRNRRLSVSLDGEIHVMQTPLHFRSLPASLRVMVPEGGQ